MTVVTQSPTNPDGGYGWVITFASFINQLLAVGIPFSVGVYYVEFLEAFNLGKGETAWIGSIHTGLLFLGGPIASALTNKLGHRLVVIAGGSLAATGSLLSSFAPNIYFLYASYGFMTGIGTCMIYIPSVVIIADHFFRRRTLAFGLASSGCGIGSLVMSILLRHIIDTYGWRGSMYITSGMFLQTCICGALMKPVTTSQNIKPYTSMEIKSQSAAKKEESTFRRIFATDLFVDCNFWILWWNNVLWNIGSLVFLVLLPDYAHSEGRSSKHDCAFLLAIFGTSVFTGRIIVGFIAGHKQVNKLYLYAIFTKISGVAIGLLPMTIQYIFLAILSSVYGLFFGLQVPLIAAVSAEVFGVRKLSSVYGYLMFADGLGALLGPPIAGWLFDATLSFAIPFYFGSGVTIFSGLIMLLIPLRMKFSQRSGSDVSMTTRSSLSDDSEELKKHLDEEFIITEAFITSV